MEAFGAEDHAVSLVIHGSTLALSHEHLPPGTARELATSTVLYQLPLFFCGSQTVTRDGRNDTWTILDR